MKLYSVSDEYIDYMRSDPLLYNIYDNKETARAHTRKYIGLVFSNNSFNYFVPLSSPKPTDYVVINGCSRIRSDVPTIWRMTDRSGILIGTIRFCGMIPVPAGELELYDVSAEKDSGYRNLVNNEILFIAKKKKNKIIRNACFLYKQKINEKSLLQKGIRPQSYMAGAVDYKYAEYKCLEFCRLKGISLS